MKDNRPFSSKHIYSFDKKRGTRKCLEKITRVMGTSRALGGKTDIDPKEYDKYVRSRTNRE